MRPLNCPPYLRRDIFCTSCLPTIPLCLNHQFFDIPSASIHRMGTEWGDTGVPHVNWGVCGSVCVFVCESLRVRLESD